MRKTSGQFIRYATVGLISNGLGFLLYLGFTAVGVGPRLAMTLLYGLGVLQTFFLNKRWSFGYSGSEKIAFARYVMIYAIGYVLNFAAMTIFSVWLGYPHQIVLGILIILFAVALFLLQKYWVFTKPEMRV